MRLIRAWILGALAALLGCVLATPAAADQLIVLCKVNSEVCKATNYAGEAFTSSSETSLGFGEIGTIKCSSTMSRNESGQISTLSFTGCSEGCSIKANGLPYAGELLSPSGGNGKIRIHSGGSGEPKLAVTCGATECVYGVEALEPEFKGGEPASIIVSKSVTRQTENFFCPKTAQWGGTYKFTSPSSAIYMINRATEGPTLCKVNEKVCPQKSVVNSVDADLQSESFFKVTKLVGGTVSCSGAGITLADYVNPFVSGPWMFKQFAISCSHPIYSNCSVIEEFVPYYAYLAPFGTGNGEIGIAAGKAEKEPTLRIECVSGKTPFVCRYSTEEFLLEFKGGAPATIQEVAAMARIEGSATFCPASVLVQASYDAFSPSTNLFLTES